MKNLSILVLIIAVAVLGYFLIKKNQAKIPAEETPSKTEVLPSGGEEEKGFLENEPSEKIVSEENEVYKITARYPSFGEPSVDAEIKSFIQSEVATFKKDNSEPYPGQTAKYSLGSTYKIVRSGEATSVIFTVENYSGGAHGNLIIKTFVYSKNGDKLSIGSFFKPGSNYLAKLSEISKKKLDEKSDEDWDESGTAPISDNFEAFYISETGNLNIIFQPYQVGPWVVGTPEISIDLENEMGSLLAD